MKKISLVFFMIVMLLLSSSNVFAGDLPETLLSDDDAQIYFGELIEVNVLSRDFKTIVKPVKKVKGDVELGVDETYVAPEFIGEFSAKKGNIYLFAYLDSSNPLYIFEIDSYDTSALKITGIKKNEMWQRFLGYINEGKFEIAEKERLERLGISETTEPYELPPLKSYSMEVYMIISILISAVAFVIYTKVSKNRLG